jgi:predicted tellurium resistance membrane protein TerC
MDALADLLAQPETWISLATLTALEIVLGIDNIVFLTILAGRLPPAEQPRARRLGLVFALATRLGLLLAISWVMGLTRPFFTVLRQEISGRDLILLVGGLFLIAKATSEIHEKLEVEGAADKKGPRGAGAFWLVIAQIAVLDLVFSLDSVITAVGMAQHLPVMVAAMILAVGVMLVFAGAIGEFVERHPSMKMLALAFLILVGVMLVAEGLGRHIEKGMVYFAMAFSLGVELLNIRASKARSAPVRLHQRFEAERPPPPA